MTNPLSDITRRRPCLRCNGIDHRHAPNTAVHTLKATLKAKRQKANCVKLIVLQTLLSHWLRLNIDAKVSPTMLPAMSATPVNGASRNKACRCGHHRGVA